MWVLLCLVGCVHATRTIHPATVLDLRTPDRLDRLLATHERIALFFYDTDCPKSLHVAKPFNQHARSMLERHVLPIRVDVQNPVLHPVLTAYRVGGAPKIVYHDRVHGVKRRWSRGNLTRWIESWESRPLLPMYSLHTSHNLVADPRPIHLLHFQSPHANSDTHLRVLRELHHASQRREDVHAFSVPYDLEHHHILQDFGFVARTGHPQPTFRNDTFVLVCNRSTRVHSTDLNRVLLELDVCVDPPP